MKQQDAPLYVATFDLCVWLHRHQSPTESPAGLDLWGCVLAASRDLVTAVVEALTFPGLRDTARQAADRETSRLKTLVPLATELEVLSVRQRRHVMGELETIGRMIGGWQRRSRSKAARVKLESGVGAPRR